MKFLGCHNGARLFIKQEIVKPNPWKVCTVTKVEQTKCRLDYFYWFFAILSIINFCGYVYITRIYTYKKVNPNRYRNSSRMVGSVDKTYRTCLSTWMGKFPIKLFPIKFLKNIRMNSKVEMGKWIQRFKKHLNEFKGWNGQQSMCQENT